MPAGLILLGVLIVIVGFISLSNLHAHKYWRVVTGMDVPVTSRALARQLALRRVIAAVLLLTGFFLITSRIGMPILSAAVISLGLAVLFAAPKFNRKRKENAP